MRKRRYTGGWWWAPLALGVLLFAAIAVWVTQGVQEAARVTDEEGLRMAQEAIERAMISCYSLEGVYPASYEELKSKSGLAIDDERYAVFYEVFASNIRPAVTVLERRVGG